ncbi:MAG: DUF4870 domain-containing protein [Phycisphaerales bacterium]|nr:DUF4870 domain-containing protein [Phycisphaerales bacterium]
MNAAGNNKANPEPPVNAMGRAYDPDATSDERTYAMFIHLSLLGHIVLTVIAIAIPIIMWAVKKSESPFLDDHGREAINFQISLLIWSLVLPVIAAIVGFLTCGVGFVLLVPAALLPYILGLVGMIQASIAANRGEFYRYPMTMRFLH